MIISKMSNVNFFIVVATVMLADLRAAYTTIVDTKTPIVIYDNGDGIDNIANDNYFGYSLAFIKGNLKQTAPHSSYDTTQQTHGTLYIGAPNEKRATKNSGIVWECDFNGGNAQLSCSIMSQLSSQHSPDATTCPNQFKSLYFPEKETEQWLGASLTANNNSHLFACAPRWKRNGWRDPMYQHSLGTCEESAMVGACYRVTSQQQQSVNVLTPLDQPEKFYYQATFTHEVNEYWFLYAQLGFSSHLTFSNILLIGAPSVRKWRGAIVEYQDFERYQYQSAFIHNEKGDIGGVEPHSLLGYTVTSGRIYDRSYYIASRAPSSYSANSIILLLPTFDFAQWAMPTFDNFFCARSSGAPRAANLLGVVKISYPRTRTPIDTYTGGQFGSYFGYALATVDLNADGYDELLVGAPWYNIDPMSPTTFSSGCVIIFDVKNSRDFPTKLCMSSHANTKFSMGSRFGSAVCSLGDINFDQRDDFAISAPYDDDGIGTIFIYHGSDPPSTNPTQVIRGKSLSIPSLHGFGTHLISGSQVDVDGNGTPDLIISSFESRHVVVLRSRPIAKPSMKISFHNEESTGHKGEIFKLGPNQKSFRVRICIRFQFSVRIQDTTTKLVAWLKFEADSRAKRVEFENDIHQTEHSFELLAAEETCVDAKLRLIGDTSQENNVNPIEFQASLKYNETELSDSQPVEHASLMISSVGAKNQQNRKFVQDSGYQQTYRHFISYLPAPIPTYSRKERLEIAKDNCDEDRNPDCDVELQIKLKIFYGQTDGKKQEQWNNGQTLLIGKLDSLAVSIAVTNRKETAYRPIVRATIKLSNNFEMNPNLLSFQWSKYPGKQGQCTSGETTSRGEWNSPITHTIQCPQPLQHGNTSNYLLEIGKLKNLKVREEQSVGELTLTVDAFPESRETDQKKTETLKLPLKANVDIDVEIPSTTQTDIDPKTTNVVDLTQLYVIKNLGVSATSIDKVKAELLIPTHFNLNKGKNLTQIIGVSNPSYLNIRCEATNVKFFSSQELGRDQRTHMNPSDTGHSRSTRSILSSLPLKAAQPEKAVVSTSSDKYLTLSNCNPDTISESCQKITCFMDLPSQGFREISIKMYFLKDGIEELVTEEIKGIRVHSATSVTYLGKVIKKTGSTQRGFILLKSVPAWIYLASGAGGTILFLLITFALFKCGFFRRKTKEQLKVLKRQTMQQMDANALAALDASIQEREELPAASEL